MLAGTHSCSWPEAGEREAELGPFKASPLSCPDGAILSGAEQGRVLPPLRRD